MIDTDGNQIGIIPTREAMQMAEERNLDLVEINPQSKPPICKILDYGKYRYKQSKKERESRLKRKTIDIKEVKFRPKIDIHDYETKKRMVEKFLKEGNKVKITVMFRGREIVYKNQGIEMINKLAEEISELGTPEKRPKSEGRNITIMIAPKSS